MMQESLIDDLTDKELLKKCIFEQYQGKRPESDKIGLFRYADDKNSCKPRRQAPPGKDSRTGCNRYRGHRIGTVTAQNPGIKKKQRVTGPLLRNALWIDPQEHKENRGISAFII